MSTTPANVEAVPRPDLSGALEAFDIEANLNGYVGLRIAPAMEVGTQSASFKILPIEELVKSRSTQRESGGNYSRGNGKFKSGTYATSDHGTEEAVDDREDKIYRNYFDSELLATKRARSIVLQSHELRVIDVVDVVSNTTAVSSGAWSATSSSKPIDDVRTACLKVYKRTGRRVNKMTVAYELFEYLKDNAQIVDRVNKQNNINVARGALTEAQIAFSFGLEELIVAGSVKNTANEGKPAVLASLWNPAHVLLHIAPRTNDIRENCFMRTLHWSEDGSEIGCAIETYRDERARSNIVRARMETDEKVINADAAELITGAFVAPE